MIVLNSKGSFVILMHVLDETFFSWIGRKWDSSLSVRNVSHFSWLHAFLNDWNTYFKKKKRANFRRAGVWFAIYLP